MLVQHSHVAWILSPCWSPPLGSDITTAFTQHCLIVFSVFIPNIGGNIATMLTEHCLNVVWMSVPNSGEQHNYNFHTPLPERRSNVGPRCWGATSPQYSHNVGRMLLQFWPTLWQSCGNVGILVDIKHWYKWSVGTKFTQCCLNIHTTYCWDVTDSTYLQMKVPHNNGINVMTTLLQCWGISWVVTLWANPNAVASSMHRDAVIQNVEQEIYRHLSLTSQIKCHEMLVLVAPHTTELGRGAAEMRRSGVSAFVQF